MLMKQKKIEQDNLASSAKVAHDRPPLQPPVVSGTLTWSSIYHVCIQWCTNICEKNVWLVSVRP